MGRVRDKVDDMADDAKHPPPGSSGVGPGISAPPSAPMEYVQLELDPTITGPGMRTEDPYEPGTELKVKGERGTFTYRYASISRSGLVSLHLVGDHTFRAVRPDQVTLARRRGC
jgi:hypothetical protein